MEKAVSPRRGERFRVEQRAERDYVPQVRKSWWLPWADIGPEGRLVEPWDNPGCLTLMAAWGRVKLYQADKGYPRWYLPDPDAAEIRERRIRAAIGAQPFI